MGAPGGARAGDRGPPQRRPARGVALGREPLGGADAQALAYGRRYVADSDVRDGIAPAGAATGERRDAPQRRDASDQPVNLGPLRRLVVDMTKCVRVTTRVTSGRLSGSSNGPATGDLPARRRIHAA